MRNPIRYSETPLEFNVPPPMLGEHTNEILQSLNLGAEEIDQLRRDGVLS
jgi:crotonobetainyl-CoA:carnitine CoA-transferase CaiB-like acyl-CoA transferase